MGGRDSAIYPIRRKMQQIVTKVMGYKTMTKVYYRIILKEKCNLKEPKNINEKICWLKVNEFENDDKVVKCADKYRVREFVKDTIGEEYLVPLIGAWDNEEQINFDELPDKFILKCNHGCAYNILVDDKKSVDIKETKGKLKKWMKEDFSYFNAEPQYHKIPRKIICEEHLGKNLMDYKFFCLNGKVSFFYISDGLLEDSTARMKHYLRDGSTAPFQRTRYKEYDFDVSKELLDKLITNAEKLAKPFDFVRVDFFLVDDKVYFSEMTFTPSGGYNNFEPAEYADILGKELNLTNFER